MWEKKEFSEMVLYRSITAQFSVEKKEPKALVFSSSAEIKPVPAKFIYDGVKQYGLKIVLQLFDSVQIDELIDQVRREYGKLAKSVTQMMIDNERRPIGFIDNCDNLSEIAMHARSVDNIRNDYEDIHYIKVSNVQRTYSGSREHELNDLLPKEKATLKPKLIEIVKTLPELDPPFNNRMNYYVKLLCKW